MNNDDYSKPKLPNREVTIAGLKAVVVPDEECLKADMAICIPAYMHKKIMESGGQEIPGTTAGFPCKVCGQDCVLAPSGQVLHAQGLRYTCMDCAIKIMEMKGKAS